MEKADGAVLWSVVQNEIYSDGSIKVQCISGHEFKEVPEDRKTTTQDGSWEREGVPLGLQRPGSHHLHGPSPDSFWGSYQYLYQGQPLCRSVGFPIGGIRKYIWSQGRRLGDHRYSSFVNRISTIEPSSK